MKMNARGKDMSTPPARAGGTNDDVSAWRVDARINSIVVEHMGASGLTPKVSGAGAPQVRRAPTQAIKMPKAWPVLASA